MKAVCIPVFNRLDMIASTLAHIHLTTGWEIYLSVDPGAPGIHEVIQNYQASLPIKTWQNGIHLGCHLNTFTVCKIAMDRGAEAILYMDDDILLSPDAFHLCDWSLAKYDSLPYAGIALCRKDANDPSQPALVSSTETWLGHFGQGYCFSRKVWFDFVLRQFWSKRPNTDADCPDWALCNMAQHLGRIVIRPRWARARHAGAIGYHGPGIGTFPDSIANCGKQDYVLE